MKRMTLEEAEALDRLLTETDPEFTDIPGVFAKQRNMLDALDEDFTNNPPTIDPNRRGTGYFTQRKNLGGTITIDSFSADYLTTKATVASA